MYGLIFLVLAILVAGIKIKRAKEPLNDEQKLAILLKTVIFFNIGLTGLLGFYAHIFMPDFTARQIGWSGGSPFQYEIGMANLAFGVLGVLSPFFRPQFWLATVIGALVLFLGCAYGHYLDYEKFGNDAPFNWGVNIYLIDIVIPLIYGIITLLYFAKYRGIRCSVETRKK